MSAPRCRTCGERAPAQSCPVCGAAGTPSRADSLDERVVRASDQTASDRDQTLSDHDQTSADQDQTRADRDQTASESDQQSSNEDQTAADSDRAAGSDKATYEQTTRAREHATDDRRAASGERDMTGHARLDTASDRELAAELRDLGADDRDRAARARDHEQDPEASRDDILSRAKHDRERAADDRTRAADDRAQAAADRKEATRERAETQRVRSESTDLLNDAATDQLTGARTRYLGLAEATRELDRARRTGSQLTLAFVDVDELQQLNDTQGLGAGDMLLRLVVDTLRANLRPHDVILRYGGDEFLCAMPNVSASEARTCLLKSDHALVAGNAGHSISFGLAQAQPSETLETLVGRAHADLHHARRSREDPG
jgi:diguanylate cyclase (GGDEF)-like protein